MFPTIIIFYSQGLFRSQDAFLFVGTRAGHLALACLLRLRGGCVLCVDRFGWSVGLPAGRIGRDQTSGRCRALGHGKLRWERIRNRDKLTSVLGAITLLWCSTRDVGAEEGERGECASASGGAGVERSRVSSERGDAFLFISLAMSDGIPLLCGASFFFSSSDCFIWLGEYAPEGVSANR